MTNEAIIDKIKEEKINVMSEFHHSNGSVRQIYLCTRMGTEFTLEKHFLNKYTIESKHSHSFNKSCWTERDIEYKIINKESAQIIYTQL